MSEMIEAVAKVIWDTEEDGLDSLNYRRRAKAVLEALKLPTDAMIEAGLKEVRYDGKLSIEAIWQAMIEEAFR